MINSVSSEAAPVESSTSNSGTDGLRLFVFAFFSFSGVLPVSMMY